MKAEVSVEPIQIYDSLRAKKVPFEPRIPGELSVYCCGPTVYGYTHIGNARAALSFDLLIRVFKAAGYRVRTARNFTDIDDKIIAAAAKEGKSSEALADYYTKAYENDLKDLQTLEPDEKPSATKTIPQMIEFVKGLLDKKKAYTMETSLGQDVYFKVESFKAYGKLSKRKLEDMIAGNRISVEEKKNHPADFALWKAAKPGEPSWESPWGPGRPGWHLECSAMIDSIFHSGIDIHMGGLDLIFPHHENEIAQSESLFERPLSTYWVHNGMVELGKEKMSKSLGNLVLTRDFIKDYGGECLRTLMLQNHYRSPLDASEENMERAEGLLTRLYVCKMKAENAVRTSTENLPPELKDLKDRMLKSLFDDLNSAKAIGFALSAARVCFREEKPELWAEWAEALPVLSDVLGLLKTRPEEALKLQRDRRLQRFGITEERSREIDEKLKLRDRLRAEKKFDEADLLRKALEAEKVQVMDGPDGSSWSISRREESKK